MSLIRTTEHCQSEFSDSHTPSVMLVYAFLSDTKTAFHSRQTHSATWMPLCVFEADLSLFALITLSQTVICTLFAIEVQFMLLELKATYGNHIKWLVVFSLTKVCSFSRRAAHFNIL